MTLLTPGQMERLKRDTAIYREFKEKLRNPVTEEVNGQKVTVMPNRTGVLQALMARYRIDAEAEQGVAEYVEQTALDGGHD